MELEKKIEELEDRIEKLEEKERRRTIMSIIKIVIVVVLYAAIIIAGIKVYQEFTEKIRPITEVQEKAEGLGLDSIFDYFK